MNIKIFTYEVSLHPEPIFLCLYEASDSLSQFLHAIEIAEQ
jgi:hypothetical protein